MLDVDQKALEAVVTFLRRRATEYHAVDLYCTTASRSTIFNHVADEIEKEFRAASPSSSPVSGGVRVKPLDWKVMTRVISDKSTWRADSMIGRYTVIDGLAWGPEPTNEVWNCIDDDAGKARCQSDYEARVRSALGEQS